MILKEQILKDIEKIGNPQFLNQIFEYLQLMKKSIPIDSLNREAVMRFAGSIDDEEARLMKQLIEDEFSNIEGEW